MNPHLHYGLGWPISHSQNFKFQDNIKSIFFLLQKLYKIYPSIYNTLVKDIFNTMVVLVVYLIALHAAGLVSNTSL